MSFGLRLFTFEQAPVVVLQREPDGRFGTPAARMEILTPVEGVAARLITAVRELMLERSVFRGQVLSMGGSDFDAGVGGITFHRRPALTPDDLVLPDGVLDRVRLDVEGVARHRERLLAGRPAPQARPAAVRPAGHRQDPHRAATWSACCPDADGDAAGRHRDAVRRPRRRRWRGPCSPRWWCWRTATWWPRTATTHRRWRPAAAVRGARRHGRPSDDADVAFLLTTNRVDILEPALAQRPGRVDLAVEIPLPDESARRRLITLYARSLPFTPAILDRAARRAQGTTASFAKELVRRAVLIAAEAGHDCADPDLEQALDEMLAESQAITRSLLGTADE